MKHISQPMKKKIFWIIVFELILIAVVYNIGSNQTSDSRLRNKIQILESELVDLKGRNAYLESENEDMRFNLSSIASYAMEGKVLTQSQSEGGSYDDMIEAISTCQSLFSEIETASNGFGE